MSTAKQLRGGCILWSWERNGAKNCFSGICFEKFKDEEAFYSYRESSVLDQWSLCRIAEPQKLPEISVHAEVEHVELGILSFSPNLWFKKCGKNMASNQGDTKRVPAARYYPQCQNISLKTTTVSLVVVLKWQTEDPVKSAGYIVREAWILQQKFVLIHPVDVELYHRIREILIHWWH